MADTWTVAVDRVLQRTSDLTDEEGAKLVGVSESTLRRWRQMRGREEEIPEPRGAPRDALLRTMDGNGTSATETPEQAVGGEDTIRFFLETFRAGAGKEPGANDRERRKDLLRAAIRRAEARGWDPALLHQELGRLVDEES